MGSCAISSVLAEPQGLAYSPDALQMHWPNLHNMPHLFALENTISPASSHARNVQEFGAIDHVIICLRISAQFMPGGPAYVPSRLTTQTPFASTWKPKLAPS